MKNKKTYLTFTFSAILLILMGSSYVSAETKSNSKTTTKEDMHNAVNQHRLDKIEAVVNQEVILTSDLKRLKKNISDRYTKSGQTLPADDILMPQIMDKLINDKLQLQIADRIGLRINDAQVDQTVQEIAKNQGKTLIQLKASLRLNGDSYTAFVDNVREELTINEIRQMQVRRRINISDQEVEQMIKRIKDQGAKSTRFKFVHIMLKTDATMTENELSAIQKKANDFAGEIKKGANATEIARNFSQGPKASEGGDWGWRTINEIPSLFASVFDDIQTKKGDVIGPFKSSMGYHIIKVTDKQGSESSFTQEMHIRHILIKSTIILNDEKAKQLLASYRQQIIEGKITFEEVAKLHSQDPGSAVRGGDLGWADPSLYVPEFKKQAETLKEGVISAPFRTRHGWHILEVLGQRKADTTEQAMKQRAYGILFKQRFPAEVYAWMNEIRQEAYIKINNPDYIIEKK